MTALAFWTMTLKPSDAFPDMQPAETALTFIGRLATAVAAQFGSFDTLDTVSGVIAMGLGLLVYVLRHRGDTRHNLAERVQLSILRRTTPLARALHGPTRTRSKHVD